MSGHIEKRVGKAGVTWRIVASAGSDPATGKRRKVNETVNGSYKDAQRRLRQIMDAVEHGAYVPAKGLALRDFIETRWWPMKASALAGTTRQNYHRAIRLHILPKLGALPVQQVRAEHIAALIGELIKQGKVRQAQIVLQLMGVIMGAALKMGLVMHNPARAVDRPRQRKAEMQVLSLPDIERLFAALEGSWVRPVIGLMLSTGLRRSEACGLQWADVNISRGELTVRRTRHMLIGRVEEVGEPKTPRSMRTLALDHGSVSLLRQHRERSGREGAMLGREITGDDYVFAWADGRPYRPDSIGHAFERAAEAIGSRVTLHGLRHTNASLLLHAGVNLRVISARLGHASPAFSLAIYSHLMADSDRDAAEKLGTVLNGSVAVALPAPDKVTV